MEEELRKIAEQSLVLPSPGLRGAFLCSMCGGSKLGLSIDPEGHIFLICVNCGNYLALEGVVRAEL